MAQKLSKPGIIFKRVATSPELEQAFSIRREVFIKEQKINEAEEWDGLDNACQHFIATHENKVIGTARVRFPNTGTAKIERMAVLSEYRRLGVGTGIIKLVERELAGQGITEVELHAQITALPFYLACGYTPHGAHFYEAEIEHVKMTKSLKRR